LPWVKILYQQVLGESEDNHKSSQNNTAAFGLLSTSGLPGYKIKLFTIRRQ